jgi:hypothetical protein
MNAPIMRADAGKCKFLTSIAASALGFVLLNYIVFADSIFSALLIAMKSGAQKNQQRAISFFIGKTRR